MYNNELSKWITGNTNTGSLTITAEGLAVLATNLLPRLNDGLSDSDELMTLEQAKAVAVNWLVRSIENMIDCPSDAYGTHPPAYIAERPICAYCSNAYSTKPIYAVDGVYCEDCSKGL